MKGITQIKKRKTHFYSICTIRADLVSSVRRSTNMPHQIQGTHLSPPGCHPHGLRPWRSRQPIAGAAQRRRPRATRPFTDATYRGIENHAAGAILASAARHREALASAALRRGRSRNRSSKPRFFHPGNAARPRFTPRPSSKRAGARRRYRPARADRSRRKTARAVILANWSSAATASPAIVCQRQCHARLPFGQRSASFRRGARRPDRLNPRR
jgi:hypothetical protein